MDATLYAYPPSDRAWVRTSFVSSVDGSAQDGDGLSGAFGGAADQRVFTIVRSLADVVLVAAGTARAEGYRPIDPGELDPDLTQGRVPALALVTRSLDVPDRLRVPGVLVVTSEAADPHAVTALREDGVEVLQHGAEEVAWPDVLADLHGRGLGRVLCEGGPSLHGELVTADLVDELCLTVAPVLAAGPGRRIATGGHGVHHAMHLAHAVAEDDVLLTRWVRARA